jgi:molybdate transport system substrate-binding protein
MSANAPVLHVMSAGSARGLVTDITGSFEQEAGVHVHATFGAVGTIRELLATDAPCDVVILSDAALAPLARAGRVDDTTTGSLGSVDTGIAVRKGAAVPAIADAAALRDALLAAAALYLPDAERATAGIHCVAMLKRLGIAGDMAPRLRAYPHGAAAMQALARSHDAAALGCTQVTEINYTPGVTLVGPLPAPFELTTPYSAAVTKSARDVDHARTFVQWVSGAKTRALRMQGGFHVEP